MNIEQKIKTLYLKDKLSLTALAEKFKINYQKIRLILGDKIRTISETNKLRTLKRKKKNFKHKKEIQKLYLKGKSIHVLRKKFKITSGDAYEILGKRIRTMSEAQKLRYKINPPNKHNLKARRKMSQSRIAFIKNNPNKVKWPKRKVASYPEKVFKCLITNNKLFEKYDIISEYQISIYSIDFAFLNIKLAVEIDGQQHWQNKENINRDKRKNKFLIKNGWKIYRIPAFKIQKCFKTVEMNFLNYLSKFKKQKKIFCYTKDIITHEKIKKMKLKIKQTMKKEREEKRKIILKKRFRDIKNETFNRGALARISRKWNVSGTQVRRIIKTHFSDYGKKIWSVRLAG